MRQVGAAELLWRLRFELSQIPASLRRDWNSRDRDTRKMAETIIAQRLAQGGLDRYEILSSAPLPEHGDLFSDAAYRVWTDRRNGGDQG